MIQRKPQPGDKVKVVEKKNYGTGKLTAGVVKDILTKSKNHPRGHKVRLTNGIIGRVQDFVSPKSTSNPQAHNRKGKMSDEPSEPNRIGPHDLI